MRVTLKILRKRKGWSQQEAADACGMSLGGYRHLEYGSRPIRQSHLAKFLEVFGPDADGLRDAVIPDDAEITAALPVFQARIAGVVAAGLWADDNEWGIAGPDLGTIPAAPGYSPAIPQFAYKVMGDSMDRKFAEGGYVIAIEYDLARESIRSGDYVIVERRESQSDRVERTVKLVRTAPDGYQLVPYSTNPVHKPISYERRANHDGDDRHVRIIGLVIGYFMPVSAA